MASNEDYKPQEKDGKEEEAISLQSDPPSDEAPGESGKSTPPLEGESPSPDQPSEPAVPGGKSPDTLKPGDTVGGYRIEKMIGRGGMAVVYRGTEISSQRVVAVKVLKERFSSSAKALARFDREFLALEALNHPNIVGVLDKGIDQGVNYFVMEHVNGASFSRLLRHRELAFNTKAQILLHIASALDYAHRRGIVHRDVKPDNVLIDRAGRAKLADFGIAQLTRSHLPSSSITVASSFMGTADYMAPEQRMDAKTVDHRADIYAFGVTMYEVFTGKLPLGNFPLPSQLNPELSKRMDGIILRALQQDPSDRYQSIAELAADIRREISVSGLSRLKARVALILQNEGWRRLFSLRTIGTVSLLAVLLYGAVWFFSATGKPSPDVQPAEPPKKEGVEPFVPVDSESDAAQKIPKNMILIPAGRFIMGTDSEFDNERPMREVYLDAFYIDKYEVTNAEYKKFVDATGHRVPSSNALEAGPFNWHRGTYPPGKEDHPVVLVNWNDARAYARWAGKRLPTAAEWEKAARGTDGRVWPWGNRWEIDRCNIGESFLNSTQPVYAFENGKSPYGCFNMAGNVMEWVADWYSETYYRSSPNRNPPGPVDGTARVVRGGAWDSNISLYARTAYRNFMPPNERNVSVGFRCAKDVPKE
jgi:serine/threonine-protein kinase